MKTLTKDEFEARRQHKVIHDTARWFAMSMLEGPLAAARPPAEIIEAAFRLAVQFLARSDMEWTRIQGKASASTPGAAEPLTPAQTKQMGMPPILTGDLSGGPTPYVPRLDALRAWAAENGARARELANRLVQSGAKAEHVSASETHEIRDAVIELLDLVEGDLS